MELDDLLLEFQSHHEKSSAAAGACNPFFDPRMDLPDISEILDSEDLFNPLQQGRQTASVEGVAASNPHVDNGHPHGDVHPSAKLISAEEELDKVLDEVQDTMEISKCTENAQSHLPSMKFEHQENESNSDTNSVLQGCKSRDYAEDCLVKVERNTDQDLDSVVSSMDVSTGAEEVQKIIDNHDDENLTDFLQSFYGDDPNLFTSEGEPADPLSMLDDILDDVDQTREDKIKEITTQQEKAGHQEEKKEKEILDSNNNEATNKSVKRFDGNAKFKAVPAFVRCLKSTETEVVPQPFKIPKPPGVCFTKIVRVDPRTEVPRTAALPPKSNLNGLYVAYPPSPAKPNATSSITVNPPIPIPQEYQRKPSIPSTNNRTINTIRRILPDRVLSHETIGVRAPPLPRQDKLSAYSYITPKMEAIKATLKGHGRIIQDSYTKELLAKKLKRLQAKNKNPGLLKILPKGNINLNSQRSLLRSNIQQNTTSNSSLSTVYCKTISPSGTNSRVISSRSSKHSLPGLTPWGQRSAGLSSSWAQKSGQTQHQDMSHMLLDQRKGVKNGRVSGSSGNYIGYKPGTSSSRLSGAIQSSKTYQNLPDTYVTAQSPIYNHTANYQGAAANGTFPSYPMTQNIQNGASQFKQKPNMPPKQCQIPHIPHTCNISCQSPSIKNIAGLLQAGSTSLPIQRSVSTGSRQSTWVYSLKTGSGGMVSDMSTVH